jgi:hypothetical protein
MAMLLERGHHRHHRFDKPRPLVPMDIIFDLLQTARN